MSLYNASSPLLDPNWCLKFRALTDNKLVQALKKKESIKNNYDEGSYSPH